MDLTRLVLIVVTNAAFPTISRETAFCVDQEVLTRAKFDDGTSDALTKT